MIVRHYNRGEGKRKRLNRLSPDAELDANLRERDKRQAEREIPTDHRGVGVVTPPRRVKVTRPKHVRRNQGYYTGGKTGQSTFYPYEPAPYLEFIKDVGRGRTRKVRDTKSTATVVAPNVPEAARIKLDHDFSTH